MCPVGMGYFGPLKADVYPIQTPFNPQSTWGRYDRKRYGEALEGERLMEIGQCREVVLKVKPGDDESDWAGLKEGHNDHFPSENF